MCVLSDRRQECQTAADCNTPGTSGNQECLSNNLDETSYCVDICEFDEECPTGFACIEGSCTFLTCVTEACDNIDNDCDGEVDENGDGTGPLSRWCYSGPDIMSVYPPCRKGVQFCQIGGMWSDCEGEIPPRAEVGLLACDGIDNDCDLCADGIYVDGICSPVEPNGFDIVYVMTGGGPANSTELIATYTYKQSFQLNSVGYGAALSMVMTILSLVASFVFIKLRSKADA